MRFTETSFYHINELTLDQENYRFGLAKSQKECIDLIYQDSPESFKNLFNDLVKNNIGDYPLVYLNDDQRIVFDGNRRISILKIINDPNLAPTDSIRQLALKVDKKSLPFNLSKIGCFISTNKEDILKTVYERHAAGQGISRINWSAFATAKFRYEQTVDDSDWRATAILLYLANTDNEVNEMINSPIFYFETFKRLIRYAYSNGYLHFHIFNEEKNTLNTEGPYFDLGLKLTKSLLERIKNQEVGLSRGKNFASKEFLNSLFSFHYKKVTEEKPPRIKKPQQKKEFVENVNTSDVALISVNDAKQEKDVEEFVLSNPIPTNAPQKPTSVMLKKPSYAKKIHKNDSLVKAINDLKVNKFNALYRSLLKIDPIEHPLLAVVGIWSLLDSLAHCLMPKNTTEFSAFFNSKLNISNKEEKKVIKAIFEFFLHEGNFNKHSGNYSSLNGIEICEKFNTIQPYIAEIIQRMSTDVE